VADAPELDAMDDEEAGAPVAAADDAPPEPAAAPRPSRAAPAGARTAPGGVAPRPRQQRRRKRR